MKRKAMISMLVSAFIMALAAPASVCHCGPGVGTPGYWKNHPEAWPVCEVTIGGITYTKEEALFWMSQPIKKDKSITMFKAAVATYLNLAIGNCGECISDWFIAADQWLGNFPVGSCVVAKSEAWQCSHGELIYWMLDDYNNGLLCAPSRD
jgi:hypothetical protein